MFDAARETGKRAKRRAGSLRLAGGVSMRLHIDTRAAGDIAVLDLRGHLVMGFETQRLNEQIHETVGQGKSRIVMNLENVTFIDSSGVGELVASLSTAKKNGGGLKLARPTEFVHDVLRATRLLNVLELYESEQEALASFH